MSLSHCTIALSAAEKSVTVQTKKQKHSKLSKLSSPHTTVWCDKKRAMKRDLIERLRKINGTKLAVLLPLI